jgi:hypothetical protein
MASAAQQRSKTPCILLRKKQASKSFAFGEASASQQRSKTPCILLRKKQASKGFASQKKSY